MSNKKPGKVKLLHLDKMLEKDVDYAELMVDLLGYKNTRYGKKYLFVKKYREVLAITEEIRTLKPNDCVYPDDSQIMKPGNVDHISFRAMMTVMQLDSSSLSQGEYIASVIATVCYSSCHEGDFDTNTNRYKRFKRRVQLSPIRDMIGLYVIVQKELKDSEDMWTRRFASVKVEDPDYDTAAGNRMAQFNVINTIKAICSDFNVTENRAWQMAYAFTQTNSYSKATEAHIQDEMRKLKEAKMRASRKRTKFG